MSKECSADKFILIPMARALSREVSTIAVGLGKASEVREVEWHVHLDKARLKAFNMLAGRESHGSGRHGSNG